MKKLATALIVLFVMQMNAQEKNVFTKSVQLQEFIPFIVSNYKKEIDSIKTKHITFLIPVDNPDEITENSIILKQGFRLLVSRLSEDDTVSIVAYSSINGEVLKPTSPKELKKVLYALNNIDASVSEKHKDGVQLGYDLANQNFNNEGINSVVIVRDANAGKKIASFKKKKEKRPRSNAILLTLISLAPEMIKILKE